MTSKKQKKEKKVKDKEIVSDSDTKVTSTETNTESIDKKEKLSGPLISIKNIKKSYGKTEVLKGITFDILDGERVALVGANGAGKTTLSEILAKVKEPTSGAIDFSFGKTKSEISSKIGIQFQDSSYPDFYKVKDLVNFMVDISEINITKAQLNFLYEQFDLIDLINETAKGLSGGQQQRLNILLAIVHNPTLLILDEIGTGLDVESRTKIKAYVKDYLNTHHATLLLVSHNADEVTELVDRVIVLHNGEVFEDRSLEDILKEWTNFDDYMNNLYLKVFKTQKDERANKSGRGHDKKEKKEKKDRKKILDYFKGSASASVNTNVDDVTNENEDIKEDKSNEDSHIEKNEDNL